jgi:hypothetical protein
MYPTLPQGLVYKITEKLLKNSSTNTKNQGLLPEDFLRILKLLFITTNVEFKGDFYSQKKGAPTGFAVSNELAEIVMEDLEKQVNQAYPNITLWARFKDDVLIIATPDTIAQVFTFINQHHQEIAWTMESEDEFGILPYLDVKLQRKPNKIGYSHYRKPTQTNSHPQRIFPPNLGKVKHHQK